MTKLTDLSLAEARDGLAQKKFSAVELTSAYVAAMARHADLNAYITPTPELALECAKASDARRAKGVAGAMEGIPIGMKDLFCTEGVRSTAASRILENFVPPYESTVSANLRDAGAVMLGKTNLDEFAMGSANVTSYFGNVANPWTRNSDDKTLVPGGSSGGSAAAVPWARTTSAMPCANACCRWPPYSRCSPAWCTTWPGNRARKSSWCSRAATSPWTSASSRK